MQASDCARASTTPEITIARRPGVRQFIAAWMLLLVVDVLRKTLGFGALCQAVSLSHSARWASRNAPIRSCNVCNAVDLASVYYFHRVHCLQSAAAAVCLLRFHGIPADLVIGVQRLPFEAHAWIESDGQVVMHDRPTLALYQPIARF